jgi:hypothetical protein
MPLRDWLAAIRSNVSYLFNNRGPGESAKDFSEQNFFAGMVKGYGRDLCRLLCDPDFDAATAAQSERDAAIKAVMAELGRRCNNGGEIDDSGIPGFRGLAIGDYVDGLDLSGIAAPPEGAAPQAWCGAYKNNRIVIAGLNFYKGVGDPENDKNHIVFAFENCIATGMAGDYIYRLSEIKAWLEGPFAIGLANAIGGIYPAIRYEYPAWESYAVFLPSEIEAYGQKVFGGDFGYYGFAMPPAQLPLYRMSMGSLAKRMNGLRIPSWLSSPAAANTYSACYVDENGRPAPFYNEGGYVGSVYGLSPIFCIA